ncbi:hypothetical protein AB1Y20_020445 [Prymnesium parvum]|uniref:Amine oxidase domain-containing protein n=1 Tax=Prymnesium parvum TaxID=97485 RepID=A0AB34JUN4_PRYPA
MAPPRLAIVGGGLAGSLCALVAHSRGLRPVIFDAGRRTLGGRFAGGHDPDSGGQFLRASEASQFMSVLAMLHENGLVSPWNGRFGVLGSRAGGFLPFDTLRKSAMLAKPEDLDTGGDFCGFLSTSAAATYVGVPSNASVCSGICNAIGAEVRTGVQVTAARLSQNGWRLEASGARDETFDAVILATHDPSLAAATVRSLQPHTADGSDHSARLGDLADALQKQRDQQRAPVFTLSARYPRGSLSSVVPFDAACVPGESHISFISRYASKPGREDKPHEELWSAVSTTYFAAELLRAASSRTQEEVETAAAEALDLELRRLCRGYFGGDDSAVPRALEVRAKRWGAGFAARTLGLNEDAICLEPWRLAICGDFVRDHPSPVESAARSGLAAGERVAAFFSSPAD